DPGGLHLRLAPDRLPRDHFRTTRRPLWRSRKSKAEKEKRPGRPGLLLHQESNMKGVVVPFPANVQPSDRSRGAAEDWTATGFRQQRRGGLFRESKRFRIDKIGMFQRVPAAQHRVTDGVGHCQPCRSGREVPDVLETVFLQLVAPLEEMVEAEH